MVKITNSRILGLVGILVVFQFLLFAYSLSLDSNNILGKITGTGTTQVIVKNDAPTLTLIPEQIWLVNNSHTIMLYDYFNDPEKIPLSFSYTSLSNISVTIDQPTGKVTLIPETGWLGERDIIFYAYDGPNTKASNNVILKVVLVMPELGPEPVPPAEEPDSGLLAWMGEGIAKSWRFLLSKTKKK